MSNTINPNIGSGIQGHRALHAGHWNGITQTVAVMNFEDAVSVEAFRATAAPVSNAVPVRLPSGVDNLVRRRTIVLNNQGGSTVYIGGTSGVTILTGYPIDPGSEKGFEIGALLDIWAISSGIPSEIRVLEIS